MYDVLAGTTVVLTREPGDNDDMLERLPRWSATAIELPCIRVEPLADDAELAAAVGGLTPLDWLVVTSRHGADAVAPFVPRGARVAAVGAATEARLRAHGLAAAFRPTRANGERLAAELPFTDGLVLLARAENAVRELPAILVERGFTVREVVAYRTIAGASGDVARVRELLAGSGPVAVIFHSPSAVEGFVGAVEPWLLARASVLVRGRTTLRAVRDRIGPEADVQLIEDREVERDIHA